MLEVIARLSSGDGRKIAGLDEERFFTLNAAWTELEKHAAPPVLAEQDALLQSAWAHLASQPGTYQRVMAGTAAHLAVAAGDMARAEDWMARKARVEGATNEQPLVEQAWFQLDIGHAGRAQEMAAQALSRPGVRGHERDKWLTLAGWVEMSQGRPREADRYFMQALGQKPEKRSGAKDEFNVAVWLLGVIQGQPPVQPSFPDLSGARLDHLAALQLYDPQQAARDLAELNADISPQWKKIISGMSGKNYASGGWDRQREAAIGKVLHDLSAL